jgi:putative hydrolase of the HAD superfamily
MTAGREAAAGRSVAFDFGAVVFHWQPLQLLRDLLPAHAPDTAAAQGLAETIFQGFRIGSDWSAFDLGQVDAGRLAERIARRSGCLAASEVRAVIDAVAPALVADPPTLALLQRLKAAGHRLHFLSNMPQPYACYLERHNADVYACFEAGLYSSQIGLMKPDAACYAHAAGRFGFGKPQAPPLFIDDSQPNVDAARAIGWDSFVYRDAAQCAAELASRGLLPHP